ncbi:MAG: redoxin domain-containing protein, partial [Sphingobacteriales bacterium]
MKYAQLLQHQAGKLWLLIVLIALFFASCTRDRSELSVSSMNHPVNATMTLEDESRQKIAVKNLNGNEKFSLGVVEPRYANLIYRTATGLKEYWIYLEGADYELVLDYKNDQHPIRSTTSAVQKELMAYDGIRTEKSRAANDSLKVAEQRFQKSVLYHRDTTRTPEYTNEIVKRWMDTVAKTEFNALLAFTQKNPSSETIPFLLGKLNGFNSEPQLALDILDQASSMVRNTKLARQLRNEAAAIVALMPGSTMPMIAGTDKNGNEFTTDVLKKVNLIICYGSYSRLMRLEHPQLRMIYDRFKNHGVQFIGVAFDKNEKFMRGVEKMDGLSWPQYANFLGAKSPNFALNNGDIPYIFIVDRNRKILSLQNALDTDADGNEVFKGLSREE